MILVVLIIVHTYHYLIMQFGTFHCFSILLDITTKVCE